MSLENEREFGENGEKPQNCEDEVHIIYPDDGNAISNKRECNAVQGFYTIVYAGLPFPVYLHLALYLKLCNWYKILLF